MTDPGDKDDERLVAAYRALPRPLPSAALDAAVLAHARAALRPARSRWIGGVATAAVLTLAIGIGWQLRHEPLADGPIAPAAPAAEGVPMAIETDSSARAPAPLERKADAGAATGADADAPERQRDNTPRAPAAADAREPSESRTSAAKAVASRVTASDELESPAVPIPSAPPAAAAPPAPAAAPDAPVLQKLEQAKRANQAPPAPLADAPVNAAQAEQAGRAESAAEPAPAPAAGMLEEFAAQPVLRAAPHTRSPLDWLEEIRRLRDQGNPDRAADELAEFRSVHPDLPIPDDLKSLLR